MQNKTLVFTATFNEVENIKNFLNIVLKINDIDVLIIDDNSPDGTSKIIEEHQLKAKNLFLVKREKKKGLDTAHKSAFNFAKEKNYQKLISLDADLSHDPKIIPQFIDQLNYSPFVIGSRYIAGGKNEMKFIRHIQSLLGNKLIKSVLGINCDEFTTSYRGFNLEKMHDFNMNRVSSRGYSFFMGTVYLVNKLGYEIKQIPITFIDRKKGVSKIPKIEALRTLKNLFLLKFLS